MFSICCSVKFMRGHFEFPSDRCGTSVLYVVVRARGEFIKRKRSGNRFPYQIDYSIALS